MFTEAKLKAMKPGDTIYLGPRRSRHAPKDPLGECIVVKRGIKWLYIASKHSVEWAKDRNIPCEGDYKVAIREWGHLPPACDGYESPCIFEDADDYLAEVNRLAVLRECQTMMRDAFNMSRALGEANIEQLSELHHALTQVMGNNK